MSPGRAWLDVPYAEKDEAKRLGARWDPYVKRWWAPPSAITACTQWAAQPDLPHVFPGEDRTFGGNNLYVDLVPATSWFTNARSHISVNDWQRLRRAVLTRAGFRCELCGNTAVAAEQLWLEAHERWRFNPQTGTQTLTRVLCICSLCHLATHFGYARTSGCERAAFRHLRHVTGMGVEDAHHHILEAEELWLMRNHTQWTVNLDLLTNLGITTHKENSE